MYLEPKIYVERVKSSNYDEDLPECKTLEPEDRTVSCSNNREYIKMNSIVILLRYAQLN